MTKPLLAIAKKLRLNRETLSGIERVQMTADAFGFLYSTPLALVGLVWLIAVTDVAMIRQKWLPLLVLLFLVYLLRRLRFFLFMEVKGTPANAIGSLRTIVVWSGALLFGRSALWLAVLSTDVRIPLIRNWRRLTSTAELLNDLRTFSLEIADATLPGLVALALYGRWGGVFPLPGLSVDAILPALYATLVQFLLFLLIWAPYVVYTFSKISARTDGSTSKEIFAKLTAVGLAVPNLLNAFAILAAGLYSQNGLGVYLFFVAGLVLASWLACQLSGAVERSQQRFRELAQLEQLGRAILHAPPDASALPTLLTEYVPGIFPSSQVEVRLFAPPQTLLQHPHNRPPAPAPLWEWLHATSRSYCFSPGDTQPWDHQPARVALVVAPVMDTETETPMGGVYVAPQRDPGAVESLLPAVQTLAAQLSSALHSARVYAQTLAHQKIEQELALAGEIQTRFLPDVLPDVPGWQLAVTLQPARQTSGDFYDVIALPNGRLGLLVADVADKGMGAALYMALSRTLIRTYATEHHTRPDFALRVANNRILTDTKVDLFVTVFYGVLDPASGTLTYCNAGHNPPYLFRIRNGGMVKKLIRTGIPLGVFKGESWEQKTVQLVPGDVLVLYTDGVTEAQDHRETFFGEERVLALVQAHQGCSAQEIQTALIEGIDEFAGGAPQFDDITLMVLVREA